MLTHDFQRLVIYFFAVVFISLIVYGTYCRRKVNSFKGTGRANDIELWSMKAALSWTCIFALSLFVILHFV